MLARIENTSVLIAGFTWALPAGPAATPRSLVLYRLGADGQSPTVVVTVPPK